MRLKKSTIFFVAILVTLSIATPALADYLGPNRTVEDGNCKVVLHKCVWKENKQAYGYKNSGSWSCQSESKPWKKYPSNSRNCNAANVGYEYWSRDGGETITYPPATITGSVQNCTLRNGWCITSPELALRANEPVSGYSITFIEGTHNGAAFPCPSGATSCTVPLDEGNNNFAYWALSSWGDSSRMGTTTAKVDTVPPTAGLDINGTSGANGWYVSPVTVTATGSDSTSGIANALLVVGGGDWQASATLNEGVYLVSATSTDNAGHTGSSATAISVDTTPPSLSFVFNGTLGDNSWYVSDVEIVPSAADVTSGLSYSEVSADGGVWTPSQTISDGLHNLDGRASDNAGNTQAIFDILRIDTMAPSSDFASDLKSQVVSGAIQLDGGSSDLTSGLRSIEVSLDGGITWETATLSGNTWTYDWDTTILHNGVYTPQIRGIDNAGNYEDPQSLTLLVDNFPPQVKITESWWIWESGVFHVTPSYFDIGEISVKISDPKGRWKPVRLSYNPSKKTGDVRWDRRFPGDVIAPSGNYRVSIVACDVHGNCASDVGVIQIPVIAVVPPTATLSPEPVIAPTQAATLPSTQIAALPPTSRPEPTKTAQAFIPVPKKVEAHGDVHGKDVFPLWVIFIFGLLAILFGTEALLDPRPEALRSLARTINQFVKE
ncbi:MAG: hypothetical protein JW730_07050 [Anaerolineales bacterium]|nr:hypothetical protein [Anaerolineales bacterium]